MPKEQVERLCTRDARMFLITGSWFVIGVQGVGADMRGGAGRQGPRGGRGGKGRMVVRRTQLQVP